MAKWPDNLKVGVTYENDHGKHRVRLRIGPLHLPELTFGTEEKVPKVNIDAIEINPGKNPEA